MGITVEAKLMSVIKTERGGFSADRSGERRWEEFLMSWKCSKKGSSEGLSSGRRWNCWCLIWGKEANNWDKACDSESETVGCGMMKVTWTFWSVSEAASLRKGVRWPMPALGRRATWASLRSLELGILPLFCKWICLCLVLVELILLV